MRAALLAIVAAAWLGCGKKDEPSKADQHGEPASDVVPAGQVGGIPSSPEPQPPAAEPDEDEPSPMAAPEADAAPAVAPVIDDTCVEDCVARNQMRAVGPEVIEADCRRECQ